MGFVDKKMQSKRHNRSKRTSPEAEEAVVAAARSGMANSYAPSQGIDKG